jgi:hypothetical protein
MVPNGSNPLRILRHLPLRPRALPAPLSPLYRILHPLPPRGRIRSVPHLLHSAELVASSCAYLEELRMGYLDPERLYSRGYVLDLVAL